jgi:uncharacterized membrane protein YdbT with pleckstrin-like domain
LVKYLNCKSYNFFKSVAYYLHSLFYKMKTTLKNNEVLLITVRQHWIRILPPLVLWLFLSIALVFFLNTIGLLIALLFTVLPIFEYINWKNNLLIITNIRLIDESGFITKFARERAIDKIINIEYDQSIFGRLFGFGNVEIQTAAENIPNRFTFIHHPEVLKNAITTAQEELKNFGMVNQANHLAKAMASANNQHPLTSNLVADEIYKLHVLQQKGIITEEEFLFQKNKLMHTD